jgi:pilus assembly protein CpaB
MGLRSITVALTGIAVAAGSAWGAREYLLDSAAIASTDPNAGLSTVVVAMADIPYGQQIQPHLVREMMWPSGSVPPGAMTSLDAVLPDDGQPARRATVAMVKGDLILGAKVSDFGEKVTIVQTLGANTRAIAIKVDAETAVGGFVTPGDSVDVLLTQGKAETLSTVTVLQNIKVVGVDQVSDENADKPEVARTVTVEVTPEQGQKLALAQKAGTLSLTLRTLEAAVDEPLDQIRLNDILGEKSPTEEVTETLTVKVRRGNEVAVEQIN